IKATWFGHACFIVEFLRRDTRVPTRGSRMLFDLAFSDRCMPSQLLGSKRYTELLCKIEDILDVYAVVISHDHDDNTHPQTTTRSTLLKQAPTPHIVAPLGDEKYFESTGISSLHWSRARRVEIPSTLFKLTCILAQHFTEGLSASDTGYRSLKDREDEAERLVCPAFKEIGLGERLGGFDLAMIHIRYVQFLLVIHCAPQDGVCIFSVIRGGMPSRCIGGLWLMWLISSSDYSDPI
ncbi:hypothetical protein EV421DRAFT_1717755, partial [Armillaria borealis]